MGALKEEYLPHYTYEEYREWEGDWELIEGVPYAMAPAPMIRHQRISARLARVLDEALDHCERCQSLVAVDWKIAEDTVVQPDNLVICHTPQHTAYLTQAPTLIFEILSPSTRTKDTGLKFSLYEREGVRHYAIVDPEEQIVKIYRLNSEGRYIKVADTHDETIAFALEACEIAIDFSKLWS